MPFEVQGEAPLTEKIAVRLQPAEKAQLREDADIAGISVSELVRRRYFGRPIVANADLMMIRELRRLGGLLKHVHNQSDGAYSHSTARALHAVCNYIDQLAATPRERSAEVL